VPDPPHLSDVVVRFALLVALTLALPARVRRFFAL
jgi:hypothetical protein